MWCARWPTGSTASASRCDGRNSAGICGRLDGSARSIPSRPTCATPIRSQRSCAMPTSWSTWSAFCSSAAGSASTPSRPTAPTRWRSPQTPSAPARPRLGDRRRRNLDLVLRALEGGRRTAGAGGAPAATIMRPSIVFGPEDSFFNRFAALARISPALPLAGGGHTRFQPVFAGDVAEAIAIAVDGGTRAGTTAWSS